MSGGEILLNSGALQGLILGMKEVSDFSLEAKLDAIIVEVKISRLDFLLLGWILQKPCEKSSKESNEESGGLTEEVLFFWWSEGVTKTLGWN